MNQHIAIRHTPWWDMHQAASPPAPLEIQCLGKRQSVVVIAKHRQKWPANGLAQTQRFQIAKIAQMPDFIGFVEFLDQFFREAAMGVGDDSNPMHRAFHNSERSF